MHTTGNPLGVEEATVATSIQAYRDKIKREAEMKNIWFPCIHKLVSGSNSPVYRSVCVCLRDPPASPCLLHALTQGMLVYLVSSTKHTRFLRVLMGNCCMFAIATLLSVTEHKNKAS